MTEPKPNEPYLIISSDCHAGLPTEEYRPYLDPVTSTSFSTDATAAVRR